MLRKLFILTLCFCSPKWVSACELRASWEPWTPYQYIDEKQNLAGLDNDLLKLVTEAIGCSLVLKEVPWKRSLTMLKAGTLDVNSGASMFEERDQEFLFSIPYRTENVSLFIHNIKRNSYRFETLEDLANSSLKLGIVRGHYYGEEFEKLKQNKAFASRISEAISYEQSFKRLQSSRIDGVLADQSVGLAIMARLNMEKNISLMRTHIYQSHVYFIFPKHASHKNIQERFNQAIRKLTKEGKIQAVIDRYLKQP